jgi:predicted enzyme related to lactoylglutathione lyase
MVVAADPSGAMFGAWEANQLNGIGLHGQTGALSWNDLRSADPDRAREFYAAVFGYHYAPVEMAGPDYTTFSLTADGLPIGGIGGMMGMDGYPSHWIVYLAVPDVDEAVSRTPELGGHVVSPGFDTPYGRMAALADPTGASFWVLTMTEQG